ncbi:hypothetical protein OPQ81_007411 [Rhizoctonia solani]|nr:hypothetical protein OPQ81_007411 [Rhizoctonia solani]
MNPNEELKMSQTGPKERTFGRLVVHVLWFLVCLATFGFPAKYRERLRLFEGLHDLKDAPWSTPATHSDRGHKDDSRQSMRQKQQEEWDRLNIAVSVITATSAAALAIQATSNNVQIYWLVTAFYSIAFGLSLEGLIIITYMTISAGGSSDEAIARLAQGKLLQVPTTYQTVKPVAFMMALPAILATYSSMSLLLGLIAMVVAGPGEGVNTQGTEYILVTIIPVGKYGEDGNKEVPSDIPTVLSASQQVQRTAMNSTNPSYTAANAVLYIPILRRDRKIIPQLSMLLVAFPR